jgi:hypothetical protein
MTRAVILGTGAFPPILRLWLEMYKKWQDEVDKVYIAIDNWNVPEARDYFINLIKEFPNVEILENLTGWPNSYGDAILRSEEDCYLIMHDDTLVYQKGIVDKYFQIAERGKVVTQKHEIYAPPDIINSAIAKKYRWTDPPFSFLLYFLFISAENLQKTSLNFNGIGWKKGDRVPLLGIDSLPADTAADTGFILAMELFDKKVPFHYIPRSETAGLASIDDKIGVLASLKENKQGIFKEGWLHLQNTGNTIPLWFKNYNNASAWDAKTEEVRLAWFLEMIRTDTWEAMPAFAKKQEEVFKLVLERCHADIEKIRKIADIFHKLLYEN